MRGGARPAAWAPGAVLGLALLAACGDGPPSEGAERDAAGAEGRMAGADGGPPDRPAAVADSLVDAWIRAAGGLEAWRSLGAARFTVTTVWYDEAGAVERMRPRRVTFRRTARAEQARIERPEAEGLYVQVFTGDTAWATLNGRPLSPDDPAAAEAEYVGRDVVYWFGLPHKLRDPGVRLAARPLPGGGHEVEVRFEEEVGANPGDRYFYRFRPGDPFPDEVHYIEQGRESRNRTRWSDYREAGPLTYVGTRLWVDEDGARLRALRIHDVVLEPALADSLFAPPDRPGG